MIVYRFTLSPFGLRSLGRAYGLQRSDAPYLRPARPPGGMVPIRPDSCPQAALCNGAVAVGGAGYRQPVRSGDSSPRRRAGASRASVPGPLP